MNHIQPLVVLGALVLWIAPPVSGQTPLPGPTHPDDVPAAVEALSHRGTRRTCSYDQRALRLWSPEVLEGRTANSIGRFGLFRPPPLESLFQRSDSAAFHFRVVEENYTPGRITSVVGQLGSLAGLVLSFSGDPVAQRWGFGLQAVGFTTGWLGKQRVSRAEEAMSRAIWWYNREMIERD